MKWFFTPPAESDPSPPHDDDQAPGLIGLPAALLQRHGARVLDPGKAVRLSGDQPPRPTVYRARTLLVPDVVRQDDDVRRTITTVLADIGIELITPGSRTAADEFDLAPAAEHRGPGPAARPSHPVVVDAWVALQTLRADGIAQKRADAAHRSRRADFAGASDGRLGHHRQPGHGGGRRHRRRSRRRRCGQRADHHRLLPLQRRDARTPIAVLFDPPARKPAGQCVVDHGRRSGGRRPGHRRPGSAVAGCGPDGAGGYTMPADSFVAVDDDIQAAIRRGRPGGPG